ncbi:MAG: GH3 auxin-responsive promoter family protein [Elusimicrobia bacterium]|nr:GH3 auxin-responsive promoter family protein [Elusimicrobiota bacterium]
MFERPLANAALLAGSLPAVLGLRRALRDPARAQADVLRGLLAANAGAAYGRAHGLAAARTVRDFQDALPVVRHEDLAPWIARAMDGESDVLTSEPVLLFETTSGSTGAVKHIPYTASLQREFRRAVGAWLGEAALGDPGLLRGPSYWSVTPLARAPGRTKGGIPVGFASDADVLGGWVGRLLERRLAVPSAVSLSGDLETALYASLRFLLQEPGLSFASVWNPSFLTLLLERLEVHGERLLADLAAGTLRPPRALPPIAAAALTPRLRAMPARARSLRPALARRAWDEVWPALRAISCWTDASAKDAVPALSAAFPRAAIQGKGLLATEGVVTIPLPAYGGCVPALQSHFLEFRAWDGAAASGGRPLLAHELEAGREYDVLLTTGGGLWRCALGDVVRVDAVRGGVPVLEFIGRGAAASDLRGEKLSAAFVGPVLRRLREAGRWDGQFGMLAPLAGEPPSYCLFIEGRAAAGLADALDDALRANPHYDYCRRLGQLAAPSVFLARGAHETYLARCGEAGTRAGAVKPAALDGRPGWDRRFAGGFVQSPQKVPA